MGSQNKVLGTSVARKYAMALSGFFLLIFLLLHVTVNLTSIISEDAFNAASHFMGANPLVQFAMQPILAFAVFFHLAMGIRLEMQNRKARPIEYARNNAAASSTWMSRNMVVTGIMVLLFLALHFYDFWLPELNVKYLRGDMSGLLANGEFRYWEELHHKFQDSVRVGLYVLAFVFLGLHLMHGFESAFQSVGFNHRRYTPLLKKLSNVYAIVVPLGFVIVAVFHFLVH